MSHRDSLLGSLPPLVVERRQAAPNEDGSESPSDSETALTESDSENGTNGSDSDINDDQDSMSDSDQYSVPLEPFCIQDAENAAVALSQCFRVFNPGRHVCKRNTEQGSSFSHCYCSVALADQYARLRSLMERRAKLQLVRDFNTRLGSFSHYVVALEEAVREEVASLYAMTHKHQVELEAAPMTKLESLSAICEELRIHVNHWNSIKQHLHTSKWLRPLIPSLCLEMYRVHGSFVRLRDSAIWWVDKLIHIGLRVFAHSDLERATPEALWSITRGIEEFNSILSSVRQNSAQEDSVSTSSHSKQTILAHHAGNSSLTANVGSGVKPVPFSRVLNILAAERSKIAAAITYRFFAENDHFLECIQNKQLPPYSWVLPSTVQKESVNSTNTSDYHTSSSTSLSDSMLKIGQIKAPDLSHENSPLIDFTTREQDFAGKFLAFVCHSTNLLRKGVSSSSAQTFHKPMTSKLPPLSPSASSSSSASASTSSASSSLNFSRQDPKRKSVSWGDAADTSVKLQLTHKYMDLLWQHFAGHLEQHFSEMTWGVGKAARGHIGNLHLCGHTLCMMLVQMMKQVYFKDLFPAGADASLMEVARQLHGVIAMAAWEAGICSAVSSKAVDRCHPVMLENEVYVTKTAKLIKDTYQPVMNMFWTLNGSRAGREDSPGKGGASPSRLVDLTLLQPVLGRLLTTSNLAVLWCQSKSQQLLASRMIGPFLLVVQSDLKVLGDEIGRVLNMSKSSLLDTHHGSSLAESQLSASVSSMWLSLSNSVAQQQSLSGLAMKTFSQNMFELAMDYFKDAMPATKVWRKKSNQAFPTEPSEYAVQGMEVILGPILDGVDKLQASTQIGVISMVTVVMCDAWTEYILKEKIKFSLYGAHQLSLDFGFIKTYLSEYVGEADARHSVLSLEVFKYLAGVIQLLKRQPRPRSRVANSREETEFSESTGSIDHLSGSLALSASDDLEGSNDDLHQEPHQVSNSCDWLALRVHGGQRTWRLPSCFPTAAEN